MLTTTDPLIKVTRDRAFPFLNQSTLTIDRGILQIQPASTQQCEKLIQGDGLRALQFAIAPLEFATVLVRHPTEAAIAWQISTNQSKSQPIQFSDRDSVCNE